MADTDETDTSVGQKEQETALQSEDSGASLVKGADSQPAVEARMTLYVVIACLLTSSGSFVMGYDAYIVGGITSFPDFLEKFFPVVLETRSQRTKYCYYNNSGVQWLTSAPFLAGLVTALPSMFFISRFGRRRVMLGCSIVFLAGIILKTAAQNVAMLLLGRILVGGAAAFSNTAIQVYCVEMAPPKQRARLGEVFQFGIAAGAMVAPLVNAGTKYLHPWGWRLSFAIAAVPALLLMLGGLVLPDTPNSLLLRGRPAEARKVLERIRGTSKVDTEFRNLEGAAADAQKMSVARSFTTILRKPYRPYLYLSASATFFQIWTGINFIDFFGPQLLVALGLDTNLVYWLVFAGSPISLLGVFTAMAFTDRIGRRAALLYTTAGMCLSFVIIGLVLGVAGAEQKWVGWLSLVVLWIYGFLFNIGWGAVATMYPTEINPIETRAAGQAIATFNQNIWNFVVGRTSLSQLCAMRYGVFFFLAGLLMLMGVAVSLFYVEPAAELDLAPEVFKRHWFWKHWHSSSAESDEEQRSLEHLKDHERHQE